MTQLCRTNNEKEYAGIPDLPRRDRLIELEYASVTDRKIRGQLRNVDTIEKQARLTLPLQVTLQVKLRPSESRSELRRAF